MLKVKKKLMPKNNILSFINIGLFLCFYSLINAHPKILIKIPTRSRPIQFFKVLDLYYQRLSGEIPYLFLISCDKDDTSMNNKVVIEKLKKYPNLHVKFGQNKTKVEAYNRDINLYLDYDIFLITSDDTRPSKGYDKRIVDLMNDHFPDFDGVINFNDGYVGSDLNTLPVLGKKYYQKFGYIYHPSYKSLCCDNEFTLVSKFLQKEFYCNDVIIRHEHPTHNLHVHYDDLYKKNDKFFLQDLENFKQRRKANFYIKKSFFSNELFCLRFVY